MRTVLCIAGGFIAGYLVADAIALHFAKQHGVHKYGGVFQHQPKAG